MEGEDGIALAPEQVLSHGELFSPSFATNEHDPDTSHVRAKEHADTSPAGSDEHPYTSRGYVEETSQSPQKDATLVFLQKGKTHRVAWFESRCTTNTGYYKY